MIPAPSCACFVASTLPSVARTSLTRTYSPQPASRGGYALGCGGQHADVGPNAPEPLKDPDEQVAIGVEQCGARPRLSRLDDLVAGREHRDRHAAEHVERGDTDGGRKRDLL